MRKPKKKQNGNEWETHVYLDAATKGALEKLAAQADRSITAEIRQAIRFYLKEQAA